MERSSTQSVTLELLERLGRFLEAIPTRAFETSISLAIVMLGAIDHLTGREMAFSAFYVIPLSMLAFRLGWRSGLRASILASVAWGLAEVTAGVRYSAPWLYAWNTLSRLLVFLFVVGLVSGIKRALADQRRLASHDPLTGVANARRFYEVVEEWYVGAKMLRHPFTVVYIDLDDFKVINDTLGHNGGDHALRTVAQALGSSTRATDIVARVGGDEFALLLPTTHSAAAVELMNHLVPRTLEALAGLPMPVTFSAGAATFLSPPNRVNEIIEAADALMYQVKHEAKGGFKHTIVGGGNAVADAAPEWTLVGKWGKSPSRSEDRLLAHS